MTGRHDDRAGAPAGQGRLAASLARLDEATGFSLGRNFLKGLWRWPHPLKDCRDRLASNLALEDRLVGGDFDELLALWGLNRQTLPDYVRYKKREALGGALLALFALGGTVWGWLHPASSRLVQALSSLACTSFVLCGLVLCLAACWRVSVCRRRRFIPFLSWLAGFFSLRTDPGDGSTDAWAGSGAAPGDGSDKSCPGDGGRKEAGSGTGQVGRLADDPASAGTGEGEASASPCADGEALLPNLADSRRAPSADIRPGPGAAEGRERPL